MTTDLFTPLALRETRIPNRLMVSPMCQYSAEAGLATEWHHVHLGSRAVGGAGLVMAEATAVEARGRISPADLGIWTDEQTDALARTASFVDDQGAVPGIQLAHAGRKGSHSPPADGGDPTPEDRDRGWETVSATDWLSDRDSWTVAQSVRLADRLAEDGADLIDVSSGGIVPESAPETTGPNYQLPLAERIGEETDSEIAVGTVGGITTPQQADAVIRNDRAALAIVGREFLRDPYFGHTAARELDATDRARAPVQYREWVH